MKKVIFGIGIPITIVFVIVVIIISMFPRKYVDEINMYAKEFSIPRYMLASVINIESGYKVDAESRAKAKGLMQLKLSTARDMANDLDLEINEESIFDTGINIRLGAKYLRYLLDMFDGNITNALASYNWGLGNVREWIGGGNVNSNGEIINIPVRETRDYLSRYKVNSFIYKNLYGM